jgi:hypothetical protein
MTTLLDDLNQKSLNYFRGMFASLAIPEPASIRGVYQGCFVGPAWLRSSAGPALALSGLGGWWGKEFSADGSAINLVLRAGKYGKCFPMKLVPALSFIDGKEGLALHYQQGNPLPWPFVVDELRRIDADTLLGMTIANLRGLRGLAFPFLLQSSKQ